MSILSFWYQHLHRHLLNHLSEKSTQIFHSKLVLWPILCTAVTRFLAVLRKKKITKGVYILLLSTTRAQISQFFLLLMFTSCPLLIADTLFPAGLENRSEQKSFKAGVHYGLETPQSPQTAKDSALKWELQVKPCFLLFQSCACWLPGHCHSSVCSTELWHQNISKIASQLQGNTPVTLLRIPLWLTGLAQHFLSSLPWVRLTHYDRTSWKQQGLTGRSRCALGML